MDRTVDKQDTAGAGPAPDGPDLARPNRISHPLRPGRWLAAGVTALVLVWFGWTIAVNPNLHWDIVVAYQFDRVILEGLWVTIQLTVASMLIGVVLGVVVALMQTSSSRILRTARWPTSGSSAAPRCWCS